MARLLLVALFIGASFQLEAQSPKRLGIVDIESQVLSDQERASLVSFYRSQIAARQKGQVLNSDEVESKLVDLSPAAKNAEKSLIEQQKRKAEIDAKIAEGKNHYLTSHFEEAITSLQSAFEDLSEIGALMTSPEVPEEVLRLIAASYFFIGDEAKAKDYLNALLDLNPAAPFSAERFPPDLVKIFTKLRLENRYPWEIWSAKSAQNEVEAHFLGTRLSVIEEEDGFKIRLPLDHPILGTQTIVLMKKDFSVASFSLKTLPEQIQWVSTNPQRRPTKGLFGPLVANASPPAELKWFVTELQLATVFLGTVSKTALGEWFLQAQFYEATTGRTSPVVTSSGDQLNRAAGQVVDQLIGYLAADGSLISNQAKRIPETNHSSEVAGIHTPFYKTWWFWTLAGAGLIGAGVGTYYLASPSETLKFQMRGP